MSFDPNLPVDVYVCFGVERGTKYPHWMLMLRSRDSARGTWYHSVGGPSQNRPYELDISGNKRVNSQGIHSMEQLGTIPANDVKKVKAAAQRVQPQQCQRYVVALVAELEVRGLLPPGQAVQLHQRVQIGKTALAYAESNPVPTPHFLAAPPGSHFRTQSLTRSVVASSSEQQNRFPTSYAPKSSSAINPSSHAMSSNQLQMSHSGGNTSTSSFRPLPSQGTSRPRQGQKKDSSCSCCIIM